MDDPNRCNVADDAARPAAVGYGLSAIAKMDQSRSFEAIVADLREILRITAGKKAKPTAVIFDSRTLQSSPESGERAEYDGAKWRRGSKTHIAVDTLGNLLALLVTPANEQDRALVGELAEKVQEVTGESVELAIVDPWFTGENAAEQAQVNGMRLEVV